MRAQVCRLGPSPFARLAAQQLAEPGQLDAAFVTLALTASGS